MGFKFSLLNLLVVVAICDAAQHYSLNTRSSKGKCKILCRDVPGSFTTQEPEGTSKWMTPSSLSDTTGSDDGTSGSSESSFPTIGEVSASTSHDCDTSTTSDSNPGSSTCPVFTTTETSSSTSSSTETPDSDNGSTEPTGSTDSNGGSEVTTPWIGETSPRGYTDCPCYCRAGGKTYRGGPQDNSDRAYHSSLGLHSRRVHRLKEHEKHQESGQASLHQNGVHKEHEHNREHHAHKEHQENRAQNEHGIHHQNRAHHEHKAHHENRAHHEHSVHHENRAQHEHRTHHENRAHHENRGHHQKATNGQDRHHGHAVPENRQHEEHH